jgi:uncharacterized membrane protein YbhN (UPF0104 family)
MPLVRILASAIMLALLLPRIHLRSLLPRWSTDTVEWLLAAVVATAAGIVLSAVRWQRVLLALDLPARIRSLVSHSFAGLFVGNFLPSTIGGDVLRVTRLSATNGDPQRTFASVVLERLSGWIVLPLISLMALAVNPGLLDLGLASTVVVAVSVVTLALLATVLLLVSSPRLGRRLQHSEGWVGFARAVHVGMDQFRRRPAAAVQVLISGLAYQLVVVLAAFLASEALDLHLGWTAVMAFMPAVAILQVLPITIGGLGVREGAFVLFLSQSGLGATTSQAVALGLVIYGINLVVSLAGAPAFAVGVRPARITA